MSYLLDTNLWIEMMRGSGSGLAKRVLERAATAPVLLSSVVLFELQYGVYKSAQRDKNRQRLLRLIGAGFEMIDFTAEDAEAAGRVRAALQARRQPIGPYDTLLAGQALARDVTLVTANHREFARVEGLKLEDWSAN